MMTMPATSPPSKLSPRATGGTGADPIGHPENPARLRQIVGVNGGNGISKAMPHHIADAAAGANLP
jgi:hypothetical protein